MSRTWPPTAADLHAGGIGGMTPADYDPVVEEIHRIRENIAESHGFDLKAIVADMQSRQVAHSGLVRLEPKRLTEADPEVTPPPESRLTRQ